MAGARGESILTLENGSEVRLLYTNRALADAEQRLNRGILPILRDFQDGGGSIHEVAVLLQVGMSAALREGRGGKNTSATRGEAYAVMDELGFAETLQAVMVAVGDVLSYGAEEFAQESEDEPDGPPA